MSDQALMKFPAPWMVQELRSRIISHLLRSKDLLSSKELSHAAGIATPTLEDALHGRERKRIALEVLIAAVIIPVSSEPLPADTRSEARRVGVEIVRDLAAELGMALVPLQRLTEEQKRQRLEDGVRSKLSPSEAQALIDEAYGNRGGR